MARNRQRAKQRKLRQQGQAARQQAAQSGDAADAATGEQPAKSEAAQPEKAKAKPAKAPATQKRDSAPVKRADSAPRERGRVVGFFRSVWAELKRVQWPDRKQMVTLTGVVIAFVIIAGAYLGLIDAIAKQVVDVTIF